MWESFKIWWSDHAFELFAWPIIVAVLVWVVFKLFGCAAIPVDVDVEQLAERVAVVMVENRLTASEGGVINEPWTARIMAIGGEFRDILVVVGGFLVYVLSHRWRLSRQILDAAKGKKCK